MAILDLTNAFKVLVQELRKLDLYVNYAKCKVVQGGAGSGALPSWAIVGEDGVVQGVIQSGPSYKYLGVLVGGRNFIKHKQHTLGLLPFAKAQTMALAQQSLDRVITGEALWAKG